MQLLLLLWFFSQDAYYLQPVRFKTTLNFFFYFVKLIMRNYDTAGQQEPQHRRNMGIIGISVVRIGIGEPSEPINRMMVYCDDKTAGIIY